MSLISKLLLPNRKNSRQRQHLRQQIQMHQMRTIRKVYRVIGKMMDAAQMKMKLKIWLNHKAKVKMMSKVIKRSNMINHALLPSTNQCCMYKYSPFFLWTSKSGYAFLYQKQLELFSPKTRVKIAPNGPGVVKRSLFFISMAGLKIRSKKKEYHWAS